MQKAAVVRGMNHLMEETPHWLRHEIRLVRSALHHQIDKRFGRRVQIMRVIVGSDRIPRQTICAVGAAQLAAQFVALFLVEACT